MVVSFKYADGQSKACRQIPRSAYSSAVWKYPRGLSLYNGMLQRVRERAVANIVQQYGYSKAFFFFGVMMVAFIAKCFNGQTHQVHGTQCMMETGMQRAGVHQVCHPQLLDIT
jgi:hypothetical protein